MVVFHRPQIIWLEDNLSLFIAEYKWKKKSTAWFCCNEKIFFSLLVHKNTSKYFYQDSWSGSRDYSCQRSVVGVWRVCSRARKLKNISNQNCDADVSSLTKMMCQCIPTPAKGQWGYAAGKKYKKKPIVNFWTTKKLKRNHQWKKCKAVKLLLIISMLQETRVLPELTFLPHLSDSDLLQLL